MDKCPARHWTAGKHRAETTHETIRSKAYTLLNIIFQDRGRSKEPGSSIPSTQRDNIPWAECSGLWGLRGSPGRHSSFSSGLARRQSFLFPFPLVCVPGPKPDGNKGKLLTEAGAKTFHLKRKRHLFTLPPPNPLFPGAVSQLTHSLVLGFGLVFTNCKGRIRRPQAEFPPNCGWQGAVGISDSSWPRNDCCQIHTCFLVWEIF